MQKLELNWRVYKFMSQLQELQEALSGLNRSELEAVSEFIDELTGSDEECEDEDEDGDEENDIEIDEDGEDDDDEDEEEDEPK